MVVDNMSVMITKYLELFRGGGSDNVILPMLKNLRDLYRMQFYGYLADKSEKEVDAAFKLHQREIMSYIMPFVNNKIKRKTITGELKLMYCDLYDDFFALTAWRDIKQFALYMELDTPEDDRVWQWNLNCFDGMWHYMNEMILYGTINRLMKQCPTGYGKSYSDIVFITFLFGKNINADIMKVMGNNLVVADFSTKVVQFMTTPRYAKVFPQFEKYNCDKNKMFKVCQAGNAKSAARYLLDGSKKGISLLIFNKDTPADGSRFMYQMYDDVTKSIQRSNIVQHEKDIKTYDTGWNNRKYSDNKVFEIFSGTTYHPQDFLSHMRGRFKADEAEQSPINKYTWVNNKTKSVFVKVPKLDYETDECTFPKKYNKAAAVEARKDPNRREAFEAMEQQNPIPLSSCPFMWARLRTYKELPSGNRTRVVAALDPARTGKNYVSMPICADIGGTLHLVDAVYRLATMKEMYDIIVQKLIYHNVTHFQIENNTDTSLAVLLTRMLREKGYSQYIEVTESYTSQPKAEKIYNNAGEISGDIVYPDELMYAPSSEVGTFMRHFTGYSYDAKNAYDDAPDSMAMLAIKFIKKIKESTKIKFIRR